MSPISLPGRFYRRLEGPDDLRSGADQRMRIHYEVVRTIGRLSEDAAADCLSNSQLYTVNCASTGAGCFGEGSVWNRTIAPTPANTPLATVASLTS